MDGIKGRSRTQLEDMSLKATRTPWLYIGLMNTLSKQIIFEHITRYLTTRYTSLHKQLESALVKALEPTSKSSKAIANPHRLMRIIDTMLYIIIPPKVPSNKWKTFPFRTLNNSTHVVQYKWWIWQRRPKTTTCEKSKLTVARRLQKLLRLLNNM